MSDEMKQRPFCGSTDLLAGQCETGDMVVCHECEASGPLSTEDDDDATLWNTRPVEDALRADVNRLIAAAEHNGLMAQAEKVKRLAAEADAERLAEALSRFATIDLTGPIGDAIAWDILNARSAISEHKKGGEG